ncbi:MAG: molybdopterin-dependent oxidoreductase, partial [Clostridium sp.]|nr:molybdopterin-dependent oxidoreductase [Clostridium sp.]
TGSTDMGTGSDTILAQMCAEVLETTMDKIVVNSADTDSSPYDPGSYASSTTYVTGMAVVKAATELRDKIINLGAERLGLHKDDVIFDGSEVKSAIDEKSISLFDLAVDVTVGPNKNQLIGYATHGSPVSPPPFIAGFVETEIDKETGKVEIIDYVAVVDCGTVINKNLAKIQVEGGIVQGIGLALYEDVVYGERGDLASNTFMQYKIPTRKDVGNIIVDFEESYEPTGPFGAKSVGEVVVNTPSPAIENAIYNGVGINLNTLPMTPEKVFMAMLDKEEAVI